MASLDIASINDEMQQMAQRSYGYGRWDAPYWFIGPEQGQGQKENNDLTRRVEAWCHFGKRELDDCREFHCRIGEKRWHKERPSLQSTWRPLILLLHSFLDRDIDPDTLRDTQRDCWGSLQGETCVIELSGLAANNLTVSRDRNSFRQKRIDVIRERMLDNRPKVVVMYGRGQRQSWKQIAGHALPMDGVLCTDGMIFLQTPHPVSFGLRDEYWKELGLTTKRFLKT